MLSEVSESVVTPPGYDHRMSLTTSSPAATAEGASIASIASHLREADRLITSALQMLAECAATAAIEASTGLGPEAALRMVCGRTRFEASELTGAAEILARMPRTRALLAEGAISWSQTKGICRAVRGLSLEHLGRIDAAVARHARALACAEPDEVVWRTEDEVAHLRADRELRRENRAIEGSFLALAPRLAGGGAIYGEADTASFATLAAAIDSAAERARSVDDPHTPPRGTQRMDALVQIAESWLSGGSATTTAARPRPRFIATCELTELGKMATSARVLWNLPGRPGKLTPLSTEVAACDAEIVPVVFDGTHPIGVGDTRKTVPDKVRTAVVARDGACRFPGCGAPSAWSDCHHIIWRDHGGDARVDNLVLLCRRHHRTLHRGRWQIRFEPDGGICFGFRGRTYRSYPRARRPARE
jgi:hypothetical protein